ncbi:MAG: HEAT repeat domain-containing protein [Planctomycetota bacterium]|jgi:hypothetical protein
MGIALVCAGCVTGMNQASSRNANRSRDRVPPPRQEWVAQVEFPADLERPTSLRESDIVDAVGDLNSAEFGHRTRGSRALLAYGEQSVPYLGHWVSIASDRPDPHCAHCIVTRAILAKLPPSRVRVYLDSPYPLARIAAAETGGERGMEELAPVLVVLLDDENPGVRRASVTALRRMTRSFLGYRADDPPQKRAKAVRAWKREVAALNQ